MVTVNTLRASPQQTAAVTAPGKHPVPALMSLPGEERQQRAAGAHTRIPDSVFPLPAGFVPLCLPPDPPTPALSVLCTHISRAKRLPFYPRLWHFSPGFHASDVCWLCGEWGGKKRKKKTKEKATSLIWQFETEFSCRPSKLKDLCLMLSQCSHLCLCAGWFSLLPLPSSMSTAS